MSGAQEFGEHLRGHQRISTWHPASEWKWRRRRNTRTGRQKLSVDDAADEREPETLGQEAGTHPVHAGGGAAAFVGGCALGPRNHMSIFAYGYR